MCLCIYIHITRLLTNKIYIKHFYLNNIFTGFIIIWRFSHLCFLSLLSIRVSVYIPQLFSVFWKGVLLKKFPKLTFLHRLTGRTGVCVQVQNLSGGELQRVALALCLGKPADVYLIDEPSAYLDSEQRLMAARVIKR